jgi:hypothetical protein
MPIRRIPVSDAVTFPDAGAVSARFELASVAELLAFPREFLRNGDCVLVRGYETAGDGGGGLFYFDALSITAANGGTVFALDAGVGRWKRVFDGAINVKWFNARGDGSTDDTSAVQASLTAGREIEIPNGTFIVSGLSVVGATGKAIRGVGTLKHKAGVSPGISDEILLLSGSTDISISGITFDGNNGQHGVWEESYDCVKVRSCQRVTFTNVTFQNINNDGIYVQSTTSLTADVNVSGCQFVGNNENRNGISIISAKRVTVTDSHFVGMSRNNMPGAIDLEPNLSSETVQDVIVSNCTFDDCKIAVVAYNDVAATCRGIVLDGNVVRTPTLNVDTNFGYYVDRFNEVSITGGYISDVYQGVLISGCDRVSIQGIRVNDWTSGGYAFKFSATVTRAHVIAHAKGPTGNIMDIDAGAEVVWSALYDGAWRFGCTDGVGYFAHHLWPTTTDMHYLGSAEKRWARCYAEEGFLSKLNVSSLGEYADNAAAVSAGVAVGQFYRTGDVLKVVHA